MKTIWNGFMAEKVLIAVLLMGMLLTLVSCASKVDDATVFLKDEFEDIWEFGPYVFTDVQQFQHGEEKCYYIGFDCVDDDTGEDKHVNAIVVGDSLTQEASRYIHSVDFERTNRNKVYYDAYLEAKNTDTLDIFSAEEVQEIQQKLEKELG